MDSNLLTDDDLLYLKEAFDAIRNAMHKADNPKQISALLCTAAFSYAESLVRVDQAGEELDLWDVMENSPSTITDKAVKISEAIQNAFRVHR